MLGTFKMIFYNNVLKKGSIQSEAQAGEYSIIHKHKLIIPNFSLLLIHVFETPVSYTHLVKQQAQPVFSSASEACGTAPGK